MNQRDPDENGWLSSSQAWIDRMPDAGDFAREFILDKPMLERSELSGAAKMLDIGCGEGYYTARFAEIAAGKGAQTTGLDVSKAAIRAAAKRYAGVMFCVASSHRLPFEDASMDAVVRIYAPCKAEELARVVKPGGWVITVTPGPRHLMELKELIYDEVRLHAPHSEQLAGFVLRQEETVAYEMDLKGDEAVALLQMTPFAWRAKPAVRETLAAQATFR